MPQAHALNLLAVSILLGMSSHTVAAPSETTVVSQPSQIAQAQSPQSQGQMEQDFQDRLRNAKTPEERARIQAEHDRMMQQGAVPGAAPDSGTNVRTGPGTELQRQRGSGSPGDSSGGGSGGGSTGAGSGSGGGAGGGSGGGGSGGR
jgi:hypothetical protein